MEILKIEQHMLPMDHTDGTLEEHRYTTDYSNYTLQAPNLRELQTQLISSFTIFTCPKPPHQIRQQLQHHKLSMTYKAQHRHQN